MKRCWELKGCPASQYIECEAYKREVDCWDIKQGCLCFSVNECGECPLFIRHLEDSEVEIRI